MSLPGLPATSTADLKPTLATLAATAVQANKRDGGSGSSTGTQPVRVMLSCDSCRRKKIRCNGGKPACDSCMKNGGDCHYSPVGPRKKPRKTPSTNASATSPSGSKFRSSSVAADQATPRHRAKRRASMQGSDDNESASSMYGHDATAGLGSVSHIMLERVKEADVLELPQAGVAGAGDAGHGQQNQPPVMEMLRLQTQISGLVDQLRNITIRASGLTPAGTPLMSPVILSSAEHPPECSKGSAAQGDTGTVASFSQSFHQQHSQQDGRAQAGYSASGGISRGGLASLQQGASSMPTAAMSMLSPSPTMGDAGAGDCNPRCDDLHISKAEHSRGISVSRDLINHLISVYFQYCHPSETGMHPIELYKDRLQRAQVSEPFLLSVLAVASRLSDDPRVKREPAYLAGHDFFERVTRGLMMDVLERDCVENMLTLNNLAVYAVGLPVANRGWYFSGLSMRMATQMSLQKVDAPGRMPGASMMSGPGIESARRAFWNTLLLEALASFASGEPPPITIQDIHVAEPYDDPDILEDEDPSRGSPDITTHDSRSSTASQSAAASANDLGASAGMRGSSSGAGGAGGGKSSPPNVCAYISQLAMLLIRVARLNGNRHPESAQFSPEYAALHTEMVAWYHGLPDSMQIKPTVAKDEIQRDPQLFAAKMFIHCHYHAAIIALHQPRVDLVRVESAGGLSSFSNRSDGVAGSEDQSQGMGGRYTNSSGMQCSHGPTESDQQWTHLAQQQCLTAACTMTELLTLARNLDVRYHIVTFGFAVFMAGVVHVGAVACTPKDSNERQYSINCVKEHVKCLDRLGKYFAFHFIMAKHIRAQLQTIEAMELRRQKEAVAALASAAAASSASSSAALNPGVLGVASRSQAASAMPFDYSAALQNPARLQSSSGMPAAFQSMGFAGMGLDMRLLGANGGGIMGAPSGAGAESPWMNHAAASPGVNGTAMASVATPNSSTSMDVFFGLLNSPQQQYSQAPAPAISAEPTTNSTPNPSFGLQGLSGMAGLGTGISSLLELFSSNSDGMASLYPENILSSSSLAPPKSPESGTTLQHRPENPVDNVGIPSSQHQQHQQSHLGSTLVQADPAAPLRLTSPGGFQQFGSLPPYSPM